MCTPYKTVGFGNKTVNLQLVVSAAWQGWLHIMQNESRDMGRLYLSN